MSDTVIRVENLSKLYRLGTVSTGTLSHDLNRWLYRVRGKEDPYLRVGESNDRTQKGKSDYVWALKDMNFDVHHGDVMGIIGRNGAGKSTLLKILSRTTTPTTGFVKIKGRVASLLEVGTGFHPELTGRENIFLNGAILGMTRKEIVRKFDEIVDFAGVERYIDTPVKRYSSGMYVRLAFAVAAHLEPEILIVDEVLAVGDAEFQKKCLGKMKDVSEKEGRTVLLVSHILTNVRNICTKALYVDKGTVRKIGSPDEIIQDYIHEHSSREVVKVSSGLVNGDIQVNDLVDFGSDIDFSITLTALDELKTQVYVDFAITNLMGDYIVHHKMSLSEPGFACTRDGLTMDYKISNPAILPGEYFFVLYVYDRAKNVLLWKEQIAPFHIVNGELVALNLRSPILPKIEVSFR
jgi:lipopolysaccharide transport system ATP-binding protein